VFPGLRHSSAAPPCLGLETPDGVPAPSNILGADSPRSTTTSRDLPHQGAGRQRSSFGFFDSRGISRRMGGGEDGFWTATTEPQVPGSHYYRVFIDGVRRSIAPAASLRVGTGKDRWIEITREGVDFYLPKDVPHGEVPSAGLPKRLEAWRRESSSTRRRGYDRESRGRFPALPPARRWSRNDRELAEPGSALKSSVATCRREEA